LQVMLQGRLYALYQRSRIILALMIFGYVCEVAAISTILGFIDDSRITNEIVAGLYICTVDGPSFFRLYIFWLPVLVYDTGLCLLALWYGISIWMSGYRARRMDGVYIADVLVKGNAGYFFCIILMCLVNIVIGQYLGLPWTKVSEEFPAPMEVVIGCRLILTLRSALVQDTIEEGDDAPWMVHVPPVNTT
ncbi:hypothetical protein J3R83DRAFT_3201, partial [Lanmaoa asiatica]